LGKIFFKNRVTVIEVSPNFSYRYLSSFPVEVYANEYVVKRVILGDTSVGERLDIEER
jgi:hypothetical protein